MKLSLSLVDLFLPLPRREQASASSGRARGRVDFDSVSIAEILTRQGFEVETTERFGAGLDSVVVGRISACEKHPQADKLRVCHVEVGGDSALQIVCGAANARAGLFVAVALGGTTLPGGLEIKPSEIRGVKSQGMLCAREELGLSQLIAADGKAEDGIWELREEDAAAALWPLLPHDPMPGDRIKLTDASFPPGRGVMDRCGGIAANLGRPVFDVMGLSDVILEVSVTPNRADGLCHLGLARELATGFAFAGKALGLRTELFRENLLTSSQIGKVLHASASTSVPAGTIEFPGTRFAAASPLGAPAFFIGVEAPALPVSPAWVRNALERIGQNSINAAVDATNLVLQLFGHPSHAFDVMKLASDADGVRRLSLRNAREGEKFTGLDGKERTLTVADAVVADAGIPQALLGVIGGEHSKVETHSRLLALEFANPDPVGVRRSSLRHGRRTDSSFLFEKGIDAATRVDAAAELAGFLRVLLGPETKVVGVTAALGPGGKACLDLEGRTRAPRRLLFRRDALLRLVGSALEEALGVGEDNFKSQCRILSLLGFEVDLHSDPAGALVTAPSWRRGDCGGEADLVEEVVRVVGIDKVPQTPLRAPNEIDCDDPHLGIASRAEGALVAAGYFETAGFHFMRPDDWSRLGLEHEEALGTPLAVLNPITAADALLQTTQIPDLLRKVQHNLRFGTTRGQLYACTRTFQNHDAAGRTLLAANFAAQYGKAPRPVAGILHDYDPALSHPYSRGGSDSASRPVESPRLAGVAFGEREPKSWWNAQALQWNLADVLAHIRSVARTVVPAAEPVRIALPDTHPMKPALHPGRSAQVLLVGKSGKSFALGWAGALHPAAARAFDIDVPCYVFELNLRVLALAESADGEFPPLVPSGTGVGAGRLMPVTRDFSFGIAEGVAAAAIEDAILDEVRSALSTGELRGQEPRVRIFDVYRGKGVAEGQKNVALSVMLQAVDRTFTDPEIRSLSEVIFRAITERLRGELRG